MCQADVVLSVLYRLTSCGCDEQELYRGIDDRRLTVEAWLTNPAVCGLRGYEWTYPDHKRVYQSLCGRNGLVAQGWVERIAGNRLRLTPAGIERARVLAGEVASASPRAHDSLAAEIARREGETFRAITAAITHCDLED